MSSENPYEAPTANVERPESARSENLERIRIGQKIAIYAILAMILAMILRGAMIALRQESGVDATVVALVLLTFVVQVAGAIAAIIGLLRIAGGLGWGWVRRLLLAVFCILPIISLLTLLAMNARATRALREGGYTVGFMGAAPRN